MVAQPQAGNLLQQRVVDIAEQVHLAANVFDVVFQRQNALGRGSAGGIGLVQIEAFEQLFVNPQFQIGHRGAQMGFELLAADAGHLFGPEADRVGPDADLDAGSELGPLSAEHFRIADQAAIQADVFQFHFAVMNAHHGVPARDQRAAQHHAVGLFAADVKLIGLDFDHTAAAFVDFVKPDFHACSINSDRCLGQVS